MNPSLTLPRWLRYSLLALCGIMLAFSFPPFRTGVFAAFAFVPLFIVFEEIQSLSRAFRTSYFAFFVLNLLSLWWVGGFVHGKDPYMMVAGLSVVFGHPLFMVIPILFFTIIHRYLNYTFAVLCFPFLWTAFEYLHSINQLAFPWLALGNTQTYDLAIIQIAPWGGVYGISFWLLWLNIMAFFLYKKLSTQQWKPFSRKTAGLCASIIVVYLLPKAYGTVILQSSQATAEGTSLTVGIVQPNIDPFEKWQSHADKQLGILQNMTNEFRGKGVDLVIWPETALPFFVFAPQHTDVLAGIRQQIDSLGVSLFTGIPDFIYYTNPDDAPASSRRITETGQRYDYFNSSMLLQPHEPEVQKYAKMILVPFAERVPYAGVFTFLQSLQWDLGLGGWAIGPEQVVFHLKHDTSTVSFSNLICYESIYPGFVANFVRRGAQFLTVITNDSWWGNSFGPYQHQRYAVMRAVENRRWVVRCANGGISCFIDPWGNTLQATQLFTRTNLIGEIKTSNEVTFYTMHGDIFAQSCLIVTGFLIAAALGKKFYHTRRGSRI